MGKKIGINVKKYDENMQVQHSRTNKIVWFDPKQRPFHINGFAWFEKDSTYRRVPITPNESIPDAVDHLANCTAGGQIRFQTDSSKLLLRVNLSGKADMRHMTAIGQCGFDCYIGEFGNQQYLNSTIYDHFQDNYEVQLFDQGKKELKTITLFFPLYQGVKEVLIGMDQSSKILPPPSYKSKNKIIFYGTSITQGGCATRPGLAYTNMLSRRFNQEIINLGFSGSGKGEQSMARLISTIENPACLVLDYEPNCVSTELYKETLPKFISIYRKKHPNVPILLISKFPYAMEQMNNSLKEERLERLAFQQDLVEKLKREGDKKLYFLEGTDLLGDHFRECTVDGVHPNDLGFMSIADKLTPILKEILNDNIQNS